MKKLYCIFYGYYIKSEKPKISYLSEKILVLLLFAVSARIKMKKCLKKKIRLRY